MTGDGFSENETGHLINCLDFGRSVTAKEGMRQG